MMVRQSVELNRFRTVVYAPYVLAAFLSLYFSDVATADEGGVSFWLPGQYGSFAASTSKPGWSFEASFYHSSATVSTGIGFARGGGVVAGIKSPIDFGMFTPTYSFETSVLGGQASLGMTALYGKNRTSASAALTGPGGASISASRSDDVMAFGDLYPTASLKWNLDVHNFMVYGTSGIPVGAYQSSRLSALGIGHWATDAGAGYTYSNEKAGFELSAVFGVTYNFINPYTQYRNGTDAHLDWAISPYVSGKMHLGAVGYFYNQLTGDSGPGAKLGGFKSRVAAVGPQVGFFFPVADRQGSLNLRAYSEFDAKNRLEGWNGWITFSVEAPEQKSEKPSRSNLIAPYTNFEIL